MDLYRLTVNCLLNLYKLGDYKKYSKVKMKAPQIKGYTHINTSVNRFVAKTEITNSREGIIAFLKNFLGEERFNSLATKHVDEIMLQLENQENEKNAVKAYINPLYENLKAQNTQEFNKKAEELISLGRFIQSLNKLEEIKILETAEPPDFIVEYKTKRIGIEITGIYDLEVVANIKSAKELLNKCQIKLSSENNIKGNIHLNIFPSKLHFSKANSSLIVDEICNYVIGRENNTKTLNLDYIEYMFKEDSDKLDLILYEDYWLTELTPEIVREAILKKENGVAIYKKKKNIDYCWLLLTIGGASSISSFDYSLLSNLNITSTFDNLFVYELFSGKLIYSKMAL